MADRTWRDGLTRRSSFRKSLAEAGLPAEYLETLEQKRRQLDESIHKYVAAKEREYKQFEKELRQQHKIVRRQYDQSAEAERRRTSSESTLDPQDVDAIERLRSSAVDTLLSNGSRRAGGGGSSADGSAAAATNVDVEQDDPAAAQARTHQELKTVFAGLTDRRASMEREKEFVGLFTPAFMPALEHNVGIALERTASDPAALAKSIGQDSGTSETLHRANSDPMVQAKPKRPSQLLLAQRTSSSGSSADGRLVSALKSPTNSSRNRRKRVSLAVGNAIVAPADNVPVPLSNNRRASHSRLRSPAPDHGRLMELAPEAVASSSSSSSSSSSPVPPPSALSASESISPKSSVVKVASLITGGVQAQAKEKSPGSPATSQTRALPSNSPHDDVGDMFLEDDHEDETAEDVDHHKYNDDELDLDDEVSDDVSGRVSDVPDLTATDANRNVAEETGAADDDDEDDDEEDDQGRRNGGRHVALPPGSAEASQQPIAAGFRRPSVNADPAFRGHDYSSAALDAEVNGIYGSSYTRAGSKGSFTGGSLGESYMARHAEEMMKTRAARPQEHVR